MGKSEEYKNQCALFNAMSEVEKKAYNKGYKWAWECSQNLNARIIKDWQDFEIVNESKIEGLEKEKQQLSECINNLVQQKAGYLHRATMAIAHLDSFDHSKAGMNKLVRSIESALEALRGES